ncbi:hypothetical protein GTA08_BOTSDO12606 [Botryosphaeria dothidea]|uniref:Uncharacterized protein n=1 Tax=Botryosphaeria dothidea TaxID=55169 RepID=A0A8H4J223_9PEZI|nr:hypothetical protein GTA08_BOTSDO12606 [Botryosphaeria dothidea]
MINNWEQYPCNESAGRRMTWNPCLDQEPPPYDDVAPRWLMPDRLSPIDKACSQRTEIFWRVTPQPVDEARMLKDADHLSRPRKRTATEALTESPDRPVNAPAKGAFKGTIPGTPTETDSREESVSSHFGDSLMAETQWALQAKEMKEAIRLSLLRRGNASGASPKEPHLSLELQEWIMKMWDYDSRAHDVYRDQLLNLGLYARCCSVGRFDHAKAEMQFDFLERSSKTQTVPGWRPSDLRRDAKEFQEWLENRICRNAVTLLTGALRDLHFTTAQVGPVQAAEKSGVEAFEQKAKCCAMAFIAFGGRV